MKRPQAFAATLGVLACSQGLATHAAAAVSLTFTPQTIDFDSTFTGSNNGGFQGGGFAPSPSTGQLDSDAWRATGFSPEPGTSFGGTHTSGDFARGSSTGGVTSGGIYAFNIGGGDTALGVQPSGGNFAPGDLTLRLRNDTGSAVSAVAVAWDVYILNDENRSNSFGFSWSTDDSTYTSTSASVTSPSFPGQIAGWQKTSFDLTLSGLSLSPGASLYFQWMGNDVSGSDSRDEFALDNITFNANSTSAIPEPSSALVGLALGCLLLRRQRS